MFSVISNTLQSGWDSVKNALEMTGEAYLTRSRIQTQVMAPSIGQGLQEGARDVARGYTNDPLISVGSKAATLAHGGMQVASQAGVRGVVRGAGQAIVRSKFGGVGWAPDALRFARGFYQGFTSGLSKYGN